MDTPIVDLVVQNAAQLLTCSDPSISSIGLISDGWVAVADGRILSVGSEETVRREVNLGSARLIDASGKVVLPGFIDCHTHVVFGGSRVDEYAARLVTSDPAELDRRGIKTGIMATVDNTRGKTVEELLAQALPRVRNMVLAGTTTVESKSGYGLSTQAEIQQLRTNKELENHLPITVVSTFLGAHGWPADIPKGDYVRILKEEMIPAVAAEGLATFCDVWCDEGHYTAEESRDILICGLKYGLAPKIHTGAYSYVGGADVAAEMGMKSADHLNYTPRSALKKLADADVAAVLLPGIDFAVRHPRPFDPQPMIDEGLILALATNCCPGCWCESMQFIMTLACRQHGLSPEQAIKAATAGSAKALGIETTVGSLTPGKAADIQIWNVPRYEDVVYRLGGNVVHSVIKDGRLVVDNGRIVS
ncbi:MAG: imidazolonepropionase [Dethiosulfovibrio peptidovorans]|nr:MAG: imidazolonepropionase [Dethiosulfovibrio peptidovorans]